MKEKILYPNKFKSILWLLVTLVFTVGGIFMILDGENMGWLVVSFFGLGIPVFILNLLPKAAYLKLDTDGFETCTMFKKTRYRWEDVHSFTTGRIHSNKMVMYNFSEKFQKQKTMRKISSGLAGSEAALQDTYGLKATELAALMNDYKQKYSTI